MTGNNNGALALVLHSHMPYVEGFGTWPFGEEWLIEAIASVYLPLLAQCERWSAEGRRDVVTLGLTPVLCDQLELSAVGERFQAFIHDVRMKHAVEDMEGFKRSGGVGEASALEAVEADYRRSLQKFQGMSCSLLKAFDGLKVDGSIELWTSAATHALLPLLATEAGMRLQVATGVSSHRRRFTGWTGGFWLPECSFVEAAESTLSEQGVEAFCIDQTGYFERLDSLEPVRTPSGLQAVPIDWPTVELVWGDSGYPAHPDYCDYHNTSMHSLRPYRIGGGSYDRERAAAVVRGHARDFVMKVLALLERYRRERGAQGLVTCALDTELLGHWWFEGIQWLAAVVEEADEAGLELTTLPKGLAGFEPKERKLHTGSWGKHKDLSTWDSSSTAEYVWAARESEMELLRAILPVRQDGAGGSGSLQASPRARAGAERACRELLALQSSDWSFMASQRLAADYPRERGSAHRREFKRAVSGLVRAVEGNGGGIEPTLGALAPDLDITTLFRPQAATLVA